MPPKQRYGKWLAASASLSLVGCGDNSADQAWRSSLNSGCPPSIPSLPFTLFPPLRLLRPIKLRGSL